MQHIVSWPGIKPVPPVVEVQSLNWVKFHLREVPGLLKWASKLEQGEKKFHLENTTVHFWCFPSFSECLARFFHNPHKKNDCVSETKRMRSDLNLINGYKQLRGGNGDQHAKCFCCHPFCWNVIKINYSKGNLLTHWLVKKSSPWPMRLNFPGVLSRHYH